MDPITILSAFIPVVAEAGKAAVNRFLGQPKEKFKPANVEQAIKLQEIEIKKLETLYNMGADGETYKWVEAVRKLQRPVVVAAVLGLWGYVHISGIGNTTTVDNMASAVGFYLFGDRTMFYIRERAR